VESPWFTDEQLSRLEQLARFMHHRGPELFVLIDAAGDTLDAWAALGDWLTDEDRRDVGREVGVVQAVADLAFIWRAVLEPFEQLVGAGGHVGPGSGT
jgi:alpha-galactosidase